MEFLVENFADKVMKVLNKFDSDLKEKQYQIEPNDLKNLVCRLRENLNKAFSKYNENSLQEICDELNEALTMNMSANVINNRIVIESYTGPTLNKLFIEIKGNKILFDKITYSHDTECKHDLSKEFNINKEVDVTNKNIAEEIIKYVDNSAIMEKINK